MMAGERVSSLPGQLEVPALGFGRWPAFRTLMVAGLLAGALMAVATMLATGRSLRHIAVVVGAVVLTFVLLALGTKAVTGQERLTQLHHQIAALAVVVTALHVTGAPVLATLDATALGAGLGIAVGRVGCLLAGCCHGRPAARGIRYGPDHLALGFPSHLVGVVLVPVQVIESLGLVAIVAAGFALVAGGAEPGTGVAFYLGSYAVLRFGMEILRGDEERPFAGGLSEAQWTSLALAAAVAGSGLGRIVPGRWWHAVPLALVAAPAVWLVLRRRAPRLSSPAHVRELAELPGSAAEPATTSLGVRVSAGHAGGLAHYTISGVGRREAGVVAELLVRLRHPGGTARVVDGRVGALHAVVEDSADEVEVQAHRVEARRGAARGRATGADTEPDPGLEDHAAT